MAKRFESNRGHSFTNEEMEDLPPFNVEEESHDAWLAYESEHGISPDEVHTYMQELETENLQINDDDIEPLPADRMVDTYGQAYDQFTLDLEGDEVLEAQMPIEEVQEEQMPTEPKKKKRVSERLSNIADRLKLDAWRAQETATDALNIIPEKAKQMKDAVTSTVDNVSTKTAITALTTQDDIMESLMEKHHLVTKNIEAKNHIRDFASGDLDKERFAYMMANDPDLHQSIGNVSHSMLHPSPINGLKTERTNIHLDVGYGFSVFMDELRQPLDNEVEAIMEIDNMSMLVEMGQDKNIPPNVRENYFQEAGITEEDMSEFVTTDDYRDYVNQLEHKFRNEHMERLGLRGQDNLDIEDENRLKELVEDSMSTYDTEEDAFVYNSGPEGEIENTYEETYDMSAEEMFQMFDSADNYDHLGYEDLEFPEQVDYDFEDASFMRHSVEEFHNLQDMSISDSQAYLENVEAEMQRYEEMSSQHDITPPDVNHAPPELNDADLASLDMQTPSELNGAPPELNDDDLAYLNDEAPPALSDDDLRDLYENDHRQQR